MSTPAKVQAFSTELPGPSHSFLQLLSGWLFLLVCISLYINGCDCPFILSSSAATDYGQVSRAFEHQGPHVSTQFVLCITFISLSVVYVKHLLRIKSNNIGMATTAIIYDEA